MKIVLTGGGSAGHVIPNLALIPELEKKFNEIHYIGSQNGIEKKLILENKKIQYHPITTVKLIRSLTLKNFFIPFKLIKGIIEAKKILKKIKPNVIFSKGGFVAVPVVIAAKSLKIPIVAHESDSTIGLANKIIYTKCNKMCFSFDNIEKKYQKKGIFTGPPIRENIFKTQELKEIKNKKFNKTLKTILFIGGSLGAKAINEIIQKNIKILTTKYNIIHITGNGNINKKLNNINNYLQIDYTNEIYNLFKLSDIVISRAGSNTIFELLLLKKPMILIPLPKEQSRGDQIINAKIFKNKKYCEIIEQKNLNIKELITTIDKTINNKEMYISNMKKSNIKNSNKEITNIIIKESKK